MKLGLFNNYEKSGKNLLTVKPAAANLENVRGANALYDVKQTKGGKVNDTQPPAMCGFFMPATYSCDCNELSGVVRNRTPQRGNTYSVSFWTLYGSRQPYNCQNVKQTKEETAMQAANNHAIGAPAPVGKGSNYPPCLLSSSVLLKAITQAKQDRHTKGKANAYGQLLAAFHRAVLPAFLIETRGNISEASRLLGLNRETVTKYTVMLFTNAGGEV